MQDLMKLDHVTDAGVEELWSLYKKGCGRQGKVKKVEHDLRAAVVLRKKQKDEVIKKQKAAQEYALTRLRNVYDSTSLMNSNYQSVFQKEREQALQKTIQQNYVQHKQVYEIDEQVAGLLMAHGADYKHQQALSGTVLQHQLFKESLSCIKKVAKRCFSSGLYAMSLASSSIDFASTGFLATELEMIELAAVSNDVAEFLAETLGSISIGVTKAACNVVDMFVYHRKQTAENFSYMLISLLQMLGGATNQYDAGLAPVHNVRSSQEVFDRSLLTCNKLCADLKEDFVKKSFQEKVEFSTEFFVEGALFSKVLSCGGKACLGVLKHVKKVPGLEKLSMAEDLIKALKDFSLTSKSDQVLVTSSGEVIPIKEIENALIEMMEFDISRTVKTSAEATNIQSMAFEAVIKRLAEQGAPFSNPQFQKEVLLYFDQYCCNQSIFAVSEDVKKLYNNISIVYKNKQIELVFDLEHILKHNLKFKINKATGLTEGRIAGGHCSLISKYLESQNLITVLEEYPLFCGGRGVKYKHLFGQSMEYKSEFACHLSQKKIMSNIMDVVKSQTEIYFDTWFNGSKQKVHKIGQASDGSIIEIFMLELSKDTLFLESAFPYCEQISKIKGLTCKK